MLLFTSGTTGAPKAAVLRNRHLVSYILGSVEFAAAGEDEILRVHEALESLARVDARLAQVAQMRYFGGYSEKEIAETLAISAKSSRSLSVSALGTTIFTTPKRSPRPSSLLGRPLPRRRNFCPL